MGSSNATNNIKSSTWLGRTNTYLIVCAIRKQEAGIDLQAIFNYKIPLNRHRSSLSPLFAILFIEVYFYNQFKILSRLIGDAPGGDVQINAVVNR